MKKRSIILISVILTVPIALWILARSLSWVAIYKVPTIGMMPAVRPGQVLFGSSLAGYKAGDMVSYRPRPFPGSQMNMPDIYLSRIVAVENDKLEIKHGSLYVNGRLADDTMNLGYFFMAASADIPAGLSAQTDRVFFYSDSLQQLNLSYKELAGYGLLKKASRLTDTQHIPMNPFGDQSVRECTEDNFGPVTVPEGYVFLMGDNRSNSIDSRHQGFIPTENIVAKIF